MQVYYKEKGFITRERMAIYDLTLHNSEIVRFRIIQIYSNKYIYS